MDLTEPDSLDLTEPDSVFDELPCLFNIEYKGDQYCSPQFNEKENPGDVGPRGVNLRPLWDSLGGIIVGVIRSGSWCGPIGRSFGRSRCVGQPKLLKQLDVAVVVSDTVIGGQGLEVKQHHVADFETLFQPMKGSVLVS